MGVPILEYEIPEELPLKEILEYRIDNFIGNNPGKSLKEMYSSLVSNYDTYVQILEEATQDHGSGKSRSVYSLLELHKFEYIKDAEQWINQPGFYTHYLTMMPAKTTDYTILDKGRTALQDISRNKETIAEFMKYYKTT